MLAGRIRLQLPAPGLKLEASVTCDPDLSASALQSLILSTRAIALGHNRFHFNDRVASCREWHFWRCVPTKYFLTLTLTNRPFPLTWRLMERIFKLSDPRVKPTTVRLKCRCKMRLPFSSLGAFFFFAFVFLSWKSFRFNIINMLLHSEIRILVLKTKKLHEILEFCLDLFIYCKTTRHYLLACRIDNSWEPLMKTLHLVFLIK